MSRPGFHSYRNPRVAWLRLPVHNDLLAGVIPEIDRTCLKLLPDSDGVLEACLIRTDPTEDEPIAARGWNHEVQFNQEWSLGRGHELQDTAIRRTRVPDVPGVGGASFDGPDGPLVLAFECEGALGCARRKRGPRECGAWIRVPRDEPMTVYGR